MGFPIGPSLGAGFGGACGAVTGVAISAGIVGSLLWLAGVPQEAGDAASAALAAGAFFYALPVLALPGIGAGLGATLGALASGTPAESAFVYGGAGALMGFCGGLACGLPSWWVVSIPLLVAYLVVGDAILLPGIFIAMAAFVPIWAIATGTVAGASGTVVDLLLPSKAAPATTESTDLQPMAF